MKINTVVILLCTLIFSGCTPSIYFSSLGVLPGDENGASHAKDISDDGRIIVGVSRSEEVGMRVFRFEIGGLNPGMREIPSGASCNPIGSVWHTEPNLAVSADGGFITGQATDELGKKTKIFLWRQFPPARRRKYNLPE